MFAPNDYKKYAVLYVDDEERSLKYFKKAFEDKFWVFTATNAEEGLDIVRRHANDIAIIMTDQRMPGQTGVQLLEQTRSIKPRAIRILATAYSEISAAIDAVNTGAIYKYITKPWDVPALEQTLTRGLEFYIVQLERDQLLKEKMSALHQMMMTDRLVSLGILASGLGHHVRNSLVAVKTFLDLAPSRLEDEYVDLNRLRNPDYWKEFYQLVQGQVRKITDLMSDLWSLSERPVEPLNESIDLTQVLNEVSARARTQAESKEISLDLQASPGLPAIHGNKAQIYRLFELLIQDEIKSLAKGHKIHIQAEPLKEGAAADWIQIRVTDNGEGLSRESLRSVFDPFFMRSNEADNVGINLMACFFIVYHHGGSIQVLKNDSDSGTTFQIRLPVNPPVYPPLQEEKAFFEKVFLNETLWENLLTQP